MYSGGNMVEAPLLLELRRGKVSQRGTHGLAGPRLLDEHVTSVMKMLVAGLGDLLFSDGADRVQGTCSPPLRPPGPVRTKMLLFCRSTTLRGVRLREVRVPYRHLRQPAAEQLGDLCQRCAAHAGIVPGGMTVIVEPEAVEFGPFHRLIPRRARRRYSSPCTTG